MEGITPTAVKVLIQFQQHSRPIEFTRVPGTPYVDLLKDAVQQVFCDVSKLGIPGAVLISKVFHKKKEQNIVCKCNSGAYLINVCLMFIVLI